MQTLILRLPPLAAAHPLPALDHVVLDTDGRVQSSGREQPALLPRGARVVAIVDAQDATLLAAALPALPAARLQAALAGALEDRLLQDPVQLHLAVGPADADGATTLACAVLAAPLRQVAADLAAAGVEPQQIVPEPALLAPGESLVQATPAGGRLIWRDTQGEAGSLPLTATDADDAAQPAVDPADPAWLARAARSDWNLRQFDLAPQHAISRGWSGVRSQLATPAWRRVGALLLLLAAVQLVGMNIAAYKLGRQESALRARITATATAALPGVPAILDARVQVQRALDAARLRTGHPGDGDLDVLMGRATAVVPAGVVPTALTFSTGQLQLTLPGDAAAQAAERCAPAGLHCSAQGQILTLGSAA